MNSRTGDTAENQPENRLETSRVNREKNPGNPPKPPVETTDQTGQVDPTRYGDWEKNGRCIDF